MEGRLKKVKVFHNKVFILLAMFFIIIITGCTLQSTNEKTINVVFRIDDYSSYSDTEIELRLIDLFKSVNGSITFGVIPYSIIDTEDGSASNVVPLSSEKIEILKQGLQEGVLDIGLHGYTHENNNPRISSEFAGVEYEIQLEKLREGKTYLESKLNSPVDIFLPPWNTYDKNTLKALEALEFSTISAYKSGDVLENTSLSYIPWTSISSDLKTSVAAARNISFSQPLIVVLLHNYDFVEIDQTRGFTTFEEFSELMNWLTLQPDVNIISIGQASELIADLSDQRYIAAQKTPPLNSFIFSTLNEKEQTKFLYPEKDISLETWIRVIGFYLLITILGLISAFLITKFIIPKKIFLIKILAILSIMITTSLLIYTFIDIYVYKKAMMINSGFFGITIGLIISFIYANKNKQDLKNKINL